MKKTRILSGIVSLAVALNYAISGYYASTVAYGQDDTDYIDYRYVGTEHAYDPLAELEAEENEKRFRETADIAGNKIAFSVIERRTAGEEAGYDLSETYKKYSLYNLSKVYETVNDSYSLDGTSAYEVFYEACTYSDDVWGIVDEMIEDENINSAEPVFIWNKASVGEPVEVSAEEFARETHYSLLETKTVWNSLKNSTAPGKGAVVAVIDTGVDYTHKDLAENIWVNSGEIPDNGVDDDGNGYVDDIHGINAVTGTGDPMDDHGHGTHVAGVIAMSAGNGGGVGLAYCAQIMCIKAGSADGTFASSDIARAVKYAVDNGADVINMSFGGEEKSSVVEAALNDAADYAVLVASAGNDGLPTSEAYENGYKNCKDVYPAGYNNVIGVMASNNEDKLAGFSNWDYITGKGCEYEMTAPGVDIYSTLPDGRYAIWSGTSMASSCVAAAAALIRSEHPQKNKYDAKYITGQLINASTSKATAEPEVVTFPVITSVSTETTTSTTTATATPADPLGNADVDGNAGISQEDFTFMLKAIVGAEALESGKGDVNNDGKVDMYDALSVLRLCSDPDSADAIISEPTANDEKIEFDIPTVDIVEDGDITNYTFAYNTDRIFKGVSGQLKFNDRDYSGEFKEINFISSSSSDIIYEFNPNNGKFVAYSASNDKSGNLTISAYDGEEGAYSIDLRSIKFYDENGKEFKDFDFGDFNPVMTFTPDRTVVAAAGTPTSVSVYDKHLEYPRLNIIDSLTRNPEPDFVVLDVTKSDNTDISDVNNGDGIIQSGETVSLGISLWNKWGAASDVTVKIEAIGFDGMPNPYVEVLDSSAALGDVAAYSGAEASVRVKVKENAPNDGKMEFKITVTSKNGFVSEYKAVYTTESEYSFIVQNVYYLSGKIKKDITLDSSRFWIIDGSVFLADGVIMTIKPGTQIQFGYEDSKEKHVFLNIENGILNCQGTEENPVIIFKHNMCHNAGLRSYYSSGSHIEYTKAINVQINVISVECDHCYFVYDYNVWDGYETYIPNGISNSIVYHSSSMSNNYDPVYAPYAESCLFNSVSLLGDIMNHQNNVYVGDIYGKSSFPNINSYSDYDNHLHYNAILDNYNATSNVYNERINRRIVEYDTMCDKARNNYYGTEAPNLIGIPDDAVEEYPDIYDSYLTLNSPEIEKIYPFMTEAYVTDEHGERIENAYPGQSLLVHVKFNRDMANDVQPDVSVGINWDRHRIPGGDPYSYYNPTNYTNYVVSGNWVSSKEWVGYLKLEDLEHARFLSDIEKDDDTYFYETIIPNLNSVKLDDILYIRSEGAVAADDRWLITGNDGGRFGFNVVKPATIQTGDSETAKLSGKGIAGANQLNWEQAEAETLAGYNLYRSTDGGVSFSKLNRSLISGEDLQYNDTDVTEGQKYSYYFTTVDTDFHESARSNVVECVPLDGEKPTIVHTPVTYSEPDKAIVITADVTDNVKVESVVLNYKYSDETDWNSVTMRNPSGSTYRTTLSAYEVMEGKLQYYIEASDGISKSYAGTESEPCIIMVSQYPETTATSEVTTTSENTTVSTNIDTSSESVETTKSQITTIVNIATASSESITESTETTVSVQATSSTAGTTASTTQTTNTAESTTGTNTTSTVTSTSTTLVTSTNDSSASSMSTTTSTTTETATETISENTTSTTEDATTMVTTTETMTETATETTSENTTSTTVNATTTVVATAETTTETNSEATSSTTDVTTESTLTTTETSTETATESTSSITGDTTSTNVTTTVTSTETAPLTTTDVPPIDYNLGDVNDDGKVDAKDASMVLVEYAKMSTGDEGDFTEKQKLAANVNFDSKIDAKDASFILAYYAMASTASGDVPAMREYMNKT